MIILSIKHTCKKRQRKNNLEFLTKISSSNNRAIGLKKKKRSDKKKCYSKIDWYFPMHIIRVIRQEKIGKSELLVKIHLLIFNPFKDHNFFKFGNSFGTFQVYFKYPYLNVRKNTCNVMNVICKQFIVPILNLPVSVLANEIISQQMARN